MITQKFRNKDSDLVLWSATAICRARRYDKMPGWLQGYGPW